ncbi:hypothetical protein [Yoonia algicola]|uniref:Uncharacterized protein n=1 Tax=Yoonia algicola TaxID=3137368 RepID=A0AAN0LZZ5_9RHOB
MADTRRVYKIDDATVVGLFASLADLFPEHPTSARFTVLQGLNYDLKEASALEGLTGIYSFQAASFSVKLGSNRQISVGFRRSLRQAQTNQLEPSARYDEFDISFGGGDGAFWEDNKELVSDVARLVSALDIAPPHARDTDDETVLHELMRGISSTHRQMLGGLDKAVKDANDRRSELEREADERDKARQEKHEEALAALAKEREQLQLQSYRSERRRIMQEITNAKALERRHGLAPTGSARARWAVFYAAILLGLISFFITYQSLALLGADEALAQGIIASLPAEFGTAEVVQSVDAALGTTNWYLIIRSIFSSLVGIGAFAYAASWLRSFYDSEVAAARSIDKYNYDLIRASWIIETVLEVKQEHDSVVPNHWIEGVTRGLFTETGSQSTTDESVQALKALLGFTASASFGPEGPKVELNRRNAKKLSDS